MTKQKRSRWKCRSIHERSRKIFIKFWRERLSHQFKGRMKLRKINQRLKLMWKLEGRSKEVQKLLYMNPIENLKLKDYSFFRRIYGTMLEAKELVCVGELEMRNKLFQESRTKDCQQIEELRRRCSWREWPSSTSKNWMNCPWCNRGILKQRVNSWLRCVWCERISWSWNCGQHLERPTLPVHP